MKKQTNKWELIFDFTWMQFDYIKLALIGVFVTSHELGLVGVFVTPYEKNWSFLFVTSDENQFL